MPRFSPQQIEGIRKNLVIEAEKLLDVPYKFGAEWTNLSDKPAYLDCSELIEGLFRKQNLEMPDGAVNQWLLLRYNITDNPRPGDIGFFIEKNGTVERPRGTVYHSGMVFDDTRVIESRGAPYNKVIFRPIIAWRQFANFAGSWFFHPDLA